MTAQPGVGVYGDSVGVTTPLAHKLGNSGLITKGFSGNAVRPGIFWGGVTSIVTGTTGMNYVVAPFTAALSRGGTSGTVVGPTNDANATVATTAAPGSNSRYDVVYVWQREFSLDGTNSNPVIGVVQGTAAASPTVPSLAAYPGAVALASILVPAGVVNTNSGTTISQLYTLTTTDGSPLRVPNTATRDRSITSPRQGDMVIREDTGWVEQYFALYNASTNPGGATPAGWYPIAGALPSGRVSRSASAVSSAGGYAVFAAAGWTLQSLLGEVQWNAAGALDGFKVPVTGQYKVTAQLVISATGAPASTAQGELLITKNGTTSTQSVLDGGRVPMLANRDCTLRVVRTIELTANDVVRVLWWHDAGGSVSVWTGGNSAFFEVDYASPPR